MDGQPRLDRIAGLHELRWLRDGSRIGERYGSNAYPNEIERELESLEEVLGTRPGCSGLGRRIGIEIGKRPKRDHPMRWENDTAVIRLDPAGEGGRDLARGWIAAWREIAERFGTPDEDEFLPAFEEALAAHRPGRRATKKQRAAWLELTFEAFVEAEGWNCGGGDVEPTTRAEARPENWNPERCRYPEPGPVRDATNWLWHLLRSSLEWDEDAVRISEDKEILDRAEELRQAHVERTEQAEIEYARLSARSVANATVAGLGRAPVMGYDDQGPQGHVIELDSGMKEGWTRNDDGQMPALDTPWLVAQGVEATTMAFRDVIGLG